MLRSLVGSEMCIRDSIDADRAHLRDGLGGLDLRLHLHADVVRIGVRLVDCLLYTSDAADDLLCVDLGGRSIIKKKKTPLQENLNCHAVHISITHNIYTKDLIYSVNSITQLE